MMLSEDDKRKKKRRQQERDRHRTNKHQRSANYGGFVKKLYSKIEKKNRGEIAPTASHSLSTRAHVTITDMITHFIERVICNEALADLLDRRKGRRIRGQDIKAAFDLVLGNNEVAKSEVNAKMDKARAKFEAQKQQQQ
jgi:hypothetical protein